MLGPLLFLIYVNSLQAVCQNTLLFADDAKIYCVIKNECDINELHKDIDRVSHWFDRWKMWVNIKSALFYR